MTRNEINAIGQLLASLRNADEGSVAVTFTAHGPCADTRNGSVSATVEAGGFDATGEAVDLDNALRIARAKLREDATARAKAAADAKSANSPATEESQRG